MQKVIRTYPNNYSHPTNALTNALSEGYEVVMCHPIQLKGGHEGLEYIVEKKEKEHEPLD